MKKKKSHTAQNINYSLNESLHSFSTKNISSTKSFDIPFILNGCFGNRLKLIKSVGKNKYICLCYLKRILLSLKKSFVIT